MDNKKTSFYILLVFCLLSLVAAAYFSFMLWSRSNQKTNIVTTPKVGKPEDSITKEIISDNQGFIYYVNGTFPNGLQKYGSGILLRGEFFVKGFSSSRGIPVYVGTLNGNTLLGSYTGSFQGSVTWAGVPTDTLKDIIKPNLPVNLKVMRTLTGDVPNDSYVNDVQSLFDNISNTMKNGTGYEIPISFNLPVSALGIVK